MKSSLSSPSSRPVRRGVSAAGSRGSLMIVALLICAIIGISLASFIQLGRTGLNISNRAFYNNAGINLAETGLEEAMWSVNKQMSDASAAWANWNPSGVNTTRKWTGFTFDQNTTGIVRVYINNYNGGGGNPKLVARATITPTTGAPIEKWIEVTLRKRSKFANGLVAKERIKFNGNNSVDSWNSDPDMNPLTPAIPYSPAVKHDNGSVGSVSVSTDAITVGNADIWGFAATGGSLPDVGPNGLVGPFGTANGTMDSSRVSTDFSANFDPVFAPGATYTSLGGNVNTAITLPRVGDVAAADGKYYYTANQVNLNNEALRITGKVVLQLTNSSSSIDIGGGNGELAVAATGASLELYAAGDVKIAGKGIANAGQPINLQIWGTKTSSTQNIDITGNGVLSAVVYAPMGSVKIAGGGSSGEIMGSIVANDITVSGASTGFHYDESLADFGGGNPYGITKWKELVSASDRGAYSLALNF